MIPRLICRLLVLLMLANHGLCLAHAHHGTDFAEPEGHGLRAHFHVGGDVQHHSSHNHNRHAEHSRVDRSGHVPGSEEHDALPPVISPADEHDSDALYCAEPVTFARDGKRVTALSAKDVAMVAILGVANQGDGLLRLGPLRGQPPSVFEAACPIYLRTLSLRL